MMFKRLLNSRVLLPVLGLLVALLLITFLLVAYFQGPAIKNRMAGRSQISPFELCFSQVERITVDLSSDLGNLVVKPSANCAARLNLTQEDPQLGNYLRRNRHLFPPDSTKSYNLTGEGAMVVDAQSVKSYRWSSDRLVYKRVLEILGKDMRGGYFVEAGAGDGEHLSETLALELDHGWSGLLIEMNPQQFIKLQGKNRRSWTSDLCLSATNFPYKGKLGHSDFGSYVDDFEGECFPLVSILNALQVSVVDFLSLDLGGQELTVLKSFPFDSHQVRIRVLSIAVRPRTIADINNIMIEKGYRVRSYVSDKFTTAQIYVHPNF